MVFISILSCAADTSLAVLLGAPVHVPRQGMTIGEMISSLIILQLRLIDCTKYLTSGLPA